MGFDGCHCAVMSSTSISNERLAMHRKNPSGYATSRDDSVRSVQTAFTCPQDPLYFGCSELDLSDCNT